jgi:hypothetical protein
LDVVKDSVDDLAATLVGADSLVIVIGFIPGNPLELNAAAHQLDNLETIALVDAAKKAGVKKVVMVSSILTNGRAWGQENKKLVAENYLKQSGFDYTTVQPGGLKAKPPTGGLIVRKEDTLNSEEISHYLVAYVCMAALTDPKASNKVLKIMKAEEGGPKVFNGLNM